MKNTKYYIAKDAIHGIHDSQAILQEIKAEGKIVTVRCLGSADPCGSMFECPAECEGETNRANLVDITLYYNLKKGSPVSINSIKQSGEINTSSAKVEKILPLWDKYGTREQYPIMAGGVWFSPSGISQEGKYRLFPESTQPVKKESPIEEITDQPEDATPKKERHLFKEEMSDEQLLVMKFLEELIPRLVKDNKNHLACAGEANGIPFTLEVHFGNKENIVEVMLKNLLDKFAGGIK